MWADVEVSEDPTTLYVRWDIHFEGGEPERLERLGGPLSLQIEASSYVDEAGKFHEHTEVAVPLFPHAGRLNRGQAKFRDHEARRRFVENLMDGVNHTAADFLWDHDPAEVPVEGHAIRISEKATGAA